jgi:hypothetical protein
MTNGHLVDACDLPLTTGECDVGPLAEYKPDSLTVRYDAENDEGVVWTTIAFAAAIAVRFTPDMSCDATMISAYSKVCELEGSPWWRELRARAESQGLILSASYRHFIVYFDHVGCWEVLAEDVAVNPG